ncbi:MAG: hypothetical protein J6I79_04045, partial [Paludibacteraceae bacterium]|nr:hypothetical protein [Paludibacteraceae bacterium]
MKKNIIKRLIPLMFLLGMSGSAVGQVLIAGTDFEPVAGKEKEMWIGITEVKTKGVLTPTFSLGTSYPKDLNYDFSKTTGKAIASHFQDGEYCAVTGNPIQLDSLHYVDDPKGGYGIVFGPQRLSANKTLFQMHVNGMKPGSSATVNIKYRSVIDDENLTKCGNGSARAQFKVAVNEDEYNQTQGKDVPQIAMGASSSTSIKAIVDASGNVIVNINGVGSYSGDCHAFEITSIEVLGEIDPVIYSIDGTSVCAGEFANLRAKSVYNGATYQWYMNNQKIAGATAANYTFETPADPGTYKFSLDITYGNKTFKSNTVEIKTEKCCEVIVDGKAVPASRKIVFMDDFGEIDLSDKTGKTYKVWDYSDITNPKQVTKKTTTPFRYALDDAPLGCKYNGTPGPIVDGEYCVAGVLTGYNAYQGMAGAHLEWANRIGGKTKPLDTPEMDHSGEVQGCALFINCNPHTAGQNIYEREITHLCQNRQLFFECYFSVFTNSANGPYNPVDITARLSEIGNSTNVVEMKGTATIQSEGGTGSWVKLSSQIFLEKNDAVKLEIINNTNVSENGNDLVLDDIIIRACAAPSLQAFFDINTFDVDTITCGNTEDQIEIYSKPSEMLTNYFGGETNTYYVYQYSTTPDDKKSWKNVAPMTHELKIKAGSTPFEGLEDGDEIYFRAIAGNKYTLENTAESEFNADNPCASYTISEPILCVISCPTCTEPKDVEITSTVKETNGVVRLCEGESTTLTTNDVLPDQSLWASSDFSGFTLEWYLDGELQKSLTNIGSTSESAATPNVIINNGVTAKEKHTWKIKVYDTQYPTSTKCIKEAEIDVEFLEQPKVENLTFEFCEGQPGATDVLPTAKTGEEYTYYQDIVDLLAGVGTASPVKAPVFSDLKAGVHEFQYTLTSADGCVSEPASITITVNAIPEYQVDAIEPFCAKQSTVAALPVADDAGKYSIEWTPAATAADLNALDGKSDPYKLTYVVSDAKTGCKAEPQEYEFTVMLATTVKLTATADCGETTVSAVTTPAGATLTYYSDDAPASEKTVFKFGEDVAEWKAVATATGYCQSADSIEVTVMAVPGLVTTADPSCYLKSKAASFTDVQTQCAPSVVAASYDASAPENKGAALEWRLAGATDWSSTAPTPTVKDATSPAEETIDYEVRLKNTATGCYGETAKFTAHIYGAPVPKVTSAEYCKGAPAGPL